MDSDKIIRQFDLEDSHGALLTCWLRDDPRLVVGAALTLRETGARVWRVAVRHAVTMPQHNVNRWWRVGGLF